VKINARFLLSLLYKVVQWLATKWFWVFGFRWRSGIMLEVGGRNIVRYNVNESIDSILSLLSSVLHFWVVSMVSFVVWCFWRFGRKYLLERYTHLYLCDNISCHEMKEVSQNYSRWHMCEWARLSAPPAISLEVGTYDSCVHIKEMLLK
jgi:hypothetical protein